MKISLALVALGLVEVVAGVYLLLGMGAALITAGIPVVAVGVIRELDE